MMLMLVVVVVASLSKMCQKVGELLKRPKSLKGLKKLQRSLVRRNISQGTGLPSRNSDFWWNSGSFSSSFCRAQELFWYSVRSNYSHGKASNAANAPSCFCPKKSGRSSSLSPAVTNGLSAPKFICKTHVLSSYKFCRCVLKEIVQAQNQLDV